MSSEKQIKAAKQNIKKAREKWQKMSSARRSAAQPKGRSRKKPGRGGEGEYYHIVVRSKEQFKKFRTQDVGNDQHTLRVAGLRENGHWDTQKWLVRKSDVEVTRNGYLRAHRDSTQKVLDTLESVPRRKAVDTFVAKPRKKIAEKDKPTPAQKRARRSNIRKAQQARHAQK